MPRNLLLAIGVIVVGILAFDTMGILVRMLGGSYPVMQIAALRNFFGVIPALILLPGGRRAVAPVRTHSQIHLRAYPRQPTATDWRV